MEQIYAFYNHGRWLGVCPKCAGMISGAVMPVKPGELFVCPAEFPDSIAMTFVPDGRPGKFVPVPDHQKQQAARQRAIEAGHAYEVLFPPDKTEIEKALILRRVEDRNWDLTMTLKQIWDENRVEGTS